MYRLSRIAAISLVVLAPCISAWAGELFQVSTYGELNSGDYAGKVTMESIRNSRNFGIGTLDGLDGELVALDGAFYIVRADGRPALIGDSEKTPFAMLTNFTPEKRFVIEAVENKAALDTKLESCGLPKDRVWALKISGLFSTLRLRSVPKQVEPFPTLAEALKGQVFFPKESIKGTMVGFRFPSQVGWVNVPGTHFHFLSDDKQSGGHVLDCAFESVTAEWAPMDSYSIAWAGSTK
jgi:acetolactate decarboxylase